MALFHVVDDAFAILRSKGVYRQAKVYSREGRLYAAHGAGYIGLTTHGTTVPSTSLVELVTDFKPQKCNLGYFYLPGSA